MKYYYREQRGGLKESLETEKEFNDYKSCLKYVKDLHKGKIKVKHYCDMDSRYFGYNIKIVTLGRQFIK